MDSFDLNTRLPPRKRLLAGLKKDGSDCDFSLPIPFISSDLSARIRDIINSTTSSPDEIVEATKSVALVAAEAATAAKTTAMEKAAAAVKARTAAKNALELLDFISKREAAQKFCPAKTKSRKKHVAVKLLYNKQPVGSRETDEELARRLHRAMNSSPRISDNKQKKVHGSGKEGVPNGGAMCNGNSPVSCDKVVQLNSGHSVDKLEEKIVVCSKDDLFEREKEESGCHSEQHNHGSKAGRIVGGRKVKIKRKKLPLSQCNIRNQGESKETPSSLDHSETGESESDHVERCISSNNAKHSDDMQLLTKITSTWKCKKLKVSQCSSDSKILHALCSNPSPTKASAMVKVD